MGVSSCFTMNYEKITMNYEPKNKAKTNPNKAKTNPTKANFFGFVVLSLWSVVCSLGSIRRLDIRKTFRYNHLTINFYVFNYRFLFLFME